MNIRAISRFEFDRLLPLNPALDEVMAEQSEWFSSRSAHLLGVIAKGEGVAGWNYAIFKRDRVGKFHVRKVMGNFFNLKAARVDLLLSMAGIENLESVTDTKAGPQKGLASMQLAVAAPNG